MVVLRRKGDANAMVAIRARAARAGREALYVKNVRITLRAGLLVNGEARLRLERWIAA